MWNLPNLLTVLRIALIPIFVLIFYLDFAWAPYGAMLIFSAAALTDWLDGFLARSWHQTSAFGTFLDPVADKLIVVVALIVLLQADPRILLALPVMVIVGREITISALREWMAEVGASGTVAVTKLGKIKTTAQMVSIMFLILRNAVQGTGIYECGIILLYLAAILTLWSMMMYLFAAWPSFAGNKTPVEQIKRQL